MADKTPVRVVFNASNVATGMAEFQSGDTVGTSFGGTGLSGIGSAGQIIKVNAAGNALEFSDQGDVQITNLVAPTNADLTFSLAGHTEFIYPMNRKGMKHSCGTGCGHSQNGGSLNAQKRNGND